jgi:hypothetical protein
MSLLKCWILEPCRFADRWQRFATLNRIIIFNEVQVINDFNFTCFFLRLLNKNVFLKGYFTFSRQEWREGRNGTQQVLKLYSIVWTPSQRETVAK